MSDREAAIVVEDLRKTYGRVEAVRGVSFSVGRGEVFGFLGPNGAGKTTTIRCMLDLLRPSGGRVSILGLDAHRETQAVHRRLGYVPGDVRLGDDLNGRRWLERYARIQGLSPVLLPTLVERLEVDLSRPIKSCSKGMRQKIAIVQAFMCDPELVILDEPTSGLDPLAQRAFAGFVGERAAQGMTVFMSSHILSEVEHICRRVAVIRRGELVAVEDVESLREKAGQIVSVTFADAVDEKRLRATPGVGEIVRRDTDGGHHYVFKVAGNMDAVVKMLGRHTVRQLIVEEAPLEDVFLGYYEGDQAASGRNDAALPDTEDSTR